MRQSTREMGITQRGEADSSFLFLLGFFEVRENNIITNNYLSSWKSQDVDLSKLKSLGGLTLFCCCLLFHFFYFLLVRFDIRDRLMAASNDIPHNI